MATQAIVTRFLPQTPKQGSRIVASLGEKRLVLAYPNAWGAHRACAWALCLKAGIPGVWKGGVVSKGTVWVQVSEGPLRMEEV